MLSKEWRDGEGEVQVLLDMSSIHSTRKGAPKTINPNPQSVRGWCLRFYI